MKKRSWCVSIATLGPIGYLVAPGTSATLATVPLVWMLQTFLGCHAWYLTAIVLVGLCALRCVSNALEYFAPRQDPSEIVIDEVVGCLVTFIAIPLTYSTMIAGFLLFRFFDISKWFGVHYFERLCGAWGVVADDVVAALWSNACLHLLVYVMCYWS